MKRVLFLCFIVLGFGIEFTVFGQERKAKAESFEIVDTSRLVVMYVHRTYDPVLDYSKAPDEMLLIGKNYSMYMSYGRYKLDSLVNSPKGLTKSEHKKYYKEFDVFLDNVVKNYKDSTLRFGAFLFMNSYRYDEPIPEIGWKLERGSEDVLGYKCKKATCRLRGRDWTAWYTTEIPISEGPWKFGGLPGMILKMTDSKDEHLIEAFEIRKAEIPFGYPERLYVKSTREKYNKEVADFKNEPWKLVEASGTVAKDKDGNVIKPRRKKLFYNPIELE